MADGKKKSGSTVSGARAQNRKITDRVVTSKTAKAEPRAFIDYTVHANYPDGSTKPVGTVEDFASCDALKSHAITEAMKSGHGIPQFKIVERDYDDSREPADHMVESEVA